MSLLSAQGLTKYYGGDVVLQDVDCSLARGEKVGLIGRNGSGKTTLLRLLTQQEDYDAGTVTLAANAQVGYLAQGVDLAGDETVWQVASSALSTTLAVERRLRHLEHHMGQAEIVQDEEALSRAMQEYARVSAEFELLGGYDSEVRVRMTLNGLGLPEHLWHQTISDLSGGQRTRVALARLLLLQPEVLLLDEPTNHLDLQAIAWLEEHLTNYRGALLVVAHDRQFLDNVVTKIWELEGHVLTIYNGNYSSYRQQKEEWAKRQDALYRQQQQERAQLQRLIAKFKSGTRAAAAKSWEKRLAKMEPIERQRQQRRLQLSIRTQRRSGNDVLSIQGLSKAYPGKQLFADFTAAVKARERIALVGANGTGKTTLMKILLGEVEADAGSLRWGASIDWGYFSQDMRLPDEDVSVLDSLLADGKLTPAEGRHYLARFLFTDESVFQLVNSLSGGERNRLILARLLLSRANVLLLDEPTNHLDILAREALEQALYDYPGTLFLVSHDRFFLRRMATRIWYFESGSILDWQGDYASLMEELAQRAVKVAPARQAQQRSKQPQPARPSLAQLQRELEQMEQMIESVERERDELYRQMADPDTYQRGGGQDIVMRCRQVEEELAKLYEEWERCAEEISCMN